MYGTRDAAANFQKEVKRFMETQGFKVSRYCPCTFWHPQRRLRVLVHGDDFVSSGSLDGLLWFKEQLSSRFEIKTKLIGVPRRDAGGLEVRPEGRILNRIVRWTSSGFEYEADLRHADLIIKELGLEEAKEVSLPASRTRAGRTRRRT